jgi:hypothetical protein
MANTLARQVAATSSNIQYTKAFRKIKEKEERKVIVINLAISGHIKSIRYLLEVCNTQKTKRIGNRRQNATIHNQLHQRQKFSSNSRKYFLNKNKHRKWNSSRSSNECDFFPYRNDGHLQRNRKTNENDWIRG